MAEVLRERPTRKPNRLTGKNYGWNGVYFLTICTKNRYHFLGAIQDGEMILSDIGKIATEELSKIEAIYPSVILDSFVIMPNHVHVLIILCSEQYNPTVQRIIQQWKGAVSKKAAFSLWQDRFDDRIVHGAAAYRRIREYIQSNPARWGEDMFFEPENQDATIPRPRADSL